MPRATSTTVNPNQTADSDYAQRDRTIAMMNAPAWRPEPGSTLTGTLVAILKAGVPKELDGYGYYPKLVVEDKDGFHAMHLFHTTAKTQLTEAVKSGLVKGDEITVHYAGMATSGKRVDAKGAAVDYHVYNVFKGDGADMTLEEFSFED